MILFSHSAKNGECGSSLTRAVFHLIEATEALKASQAGVAADLRANVVGEMKKWQKGNYRKNLVGKVKEATDIEAGFDASQAPWIKLLKKLYKSKQRYYDLSKKVLVTIAARGDSEGQDLSGWLCRLLTNETGCRIIVGLMRASY